MHHLRFFFFYFSVVCTLSAAFAMMLPCLVVADAIALVPQHSADGDPVVRQLPPAPDDVTIEPDLSYLEPGRNELLDLYLPANRPADKLSPGVVLVHGGGWPTDVFDCNESGDNRC